MSKRIRYLFEYMVFMVFLGAFRVLPYRVASFFGGFIVENLGFFLKANKVAKQNLDFVFPDMDGSKKRKILAGVWNNLGRNFAEYPHIVSFSDKKYYSLVDVIGEEKIQKFIEEKKSLIFISAHFSNWDIMYKYFAIRNIKTNMIFRAANNPLINKVVVGMKNMKNFKMYEKGLAGAGKAVRGVLKGEVLATFIDQKLSEVSESILFDTCNHPHFCEFHFLLHVRVGHTNRLNFQLGE